MRKEMLIMVTGTYFTPEIENESLSIYLKEYKADHAKLIYAYKKAVTAHEWDKFKKKLYDTGEDD